MTAEYRIASLADFTLIPSDRLEACLEDFAVWLRLHAKQAEINAAASRMLGGATKFSTDSFTWADDGVVGCSAFDVLCDNEKIGRIPMGAKP